MCLFNRAATTEIYTCGHTLSLHDALPISRWRSSPAATVPPCARPTIFSGATRPQRSSRSTASPAPAPEAERSEEHTSELQSLMRISYAVFCLKKTLNNHIIHLFILHLLSIHQYHLITYLLLVHIS